ncbi:MAG TPA: hypothetical protein VFT15_05695 [Chitinophagaceae bacterium]|nr:hypothetical protein [Chitinophagaceae bacterium]
MKHLLFLLILAPNFIMAQDCTLKNEKDRFNQDPRLTTGFVSLGGGNDKFLLSISADKKEIDYFFALDNSVMCFNDISRVMVTFVSKQRGNFKNGGTTNCKGYFHFVFPNQPNLNPNLTNLSQKKIATIQFTDTDNNKKILTLTPKDQDAILQLTTCVLAELEKLRVDTWKPKQ